MIKWHDLKKNPTDLPTDSRNVLAYVDMGEVFDFRCVHFSPVSREWYYAADASMVEFEILKWAYVEYTEDAKPSPQHDLTELRDALIKGVENVDNQIHEFAADVKRNGDSFSEALTCALIGYMASEVKYGILKEFAEHGETD